jgi:hypothetical protein
MRGVEPAHFLLKCSRNISEFSWSLTSAARGDGGSPFMRTQSPPGDSFLVVDNFVWW